MIFPFLLYNFSISRHPLTFHARTLYTFIFVVLGIISACKPGVDLCMSLHLDTLGVLHNLCLIIPIQFLKAMCVHI